MPFDSYKVGLLPKERIVKPEFALSPCALNSSPKKDVSTLPDILPNACIVVVTFNEFSVASEPLVISFFQFGISLFIRLATDYSDHFPHGP